MKSKAKKRWRLRPGKIKLARRIFKIKGWGS